MWAVRWGIAMGFVALGCSSDERARRADLVDTNTNGGEADAGPTHRYDPSIYSFVATNVYHDFPSLDEKQAYKFEIFMDSAIEPAQIDTLRVSGPHGFTFDFINQPFAGTVNGYLSNERQPVLWYQGIQVGGVLEDGEYTLDVAFADGGRGTRSRTLISNFSLRDFYLSHRDEMTYRPSGGTSPADTALEWSTLRDLGGPDAYYIGWLSSGTSEAIDGNTARGNNIFIGALLNQKAGLNLGKSTPGSVDDPLTAGPQTWQVEIVDSNQLDGINMIVFTPGQHFIAD